jgi:Glycosyltransferase family 87
VRVEERIRRPFERLRDDPGAIGWMVLVALVYGFATYVRSQATAPWGTDHMMSLASDLVAGHSDLSFSQLTTSNDIVTFDGRYYQAMSLLPTVPYLPLVPFSFLWPLSRWIVSAVIGMTAGWLALPLARRYGPGGAADYWLAALGAFGTLLFTLTIEGDFYYLAHLEAVLLSFLLLIEWKQERRPWVIGLLIGLAALARPTLLLVAVPFGLALLLERKDRVWAAATFAVPILAALAVTAWWDYVRFGSALETGYTLSYVTPQLQALRDQGLFSIAHLPANLALFIGGGFGVRDTFPWLVPSDQGDSILLTTPAVLIAVGAGLRDRLNQVLWGAAILAAIPVFLYYGGGGAATYGYRYAMDFMPFLIALVAIAMRERFGNLERILIGLSVVFVCYDYVWLLFK